MGYLTVQEKIEMIFIYGECGRNLDAAVNLCAERFPGTAISRSSFVRVVKQFSTDGSVQPKKRTRCPTICGEKNQISVLAAVNYNPHASIREISHQSSIPRMSVWKIFKYHKFHPYHVSLHQELTDNDFHNRLTFCQWAVERVQQSPNFFARVLFSDESTFTNHGNVNRHNMHYWSVENPHWIREVNHQRPWSVNVWCGIIGDKLIGPYFIDGNLNGIKYRNILEEKLPRLLEDVSLEVRQNMWFQHDGCPAHYSRGAREVLDRLYNNRWIGRKGPINWPARSPDLTSPDFFLWGYLKDKVYKEKPTTRENMMQRIIDACAAITPDMLMRCVKEFEARINKCIEVQGHQFEQLI